MKKLRRFHAPEPNYLILSAAFKYTEEVEIMLYNVSNYHILNKVIGYVNRPQIATFKTILHGQSLFKELFMCVPVLFKLFIVELGKYILLIFEVSLSVGYELVKKCLSIILSALNEAVSYDLI